jgi:UPF0755 protein
MSGRHSGEEGTPDDELIPFTTESAPAGSPDTQPDQEIHHPEPPADAGARESGPPPDPGARESGPPPAAGVRRAGLPPEGGAEPSDARSDERSGPPHGEPYEPAGPVSAEPYEPAGPVSAEPYEPAGPVSAEPYESAGSPATAGTEPSPTTAEHSRAERADGDLDNVHDGAGRPREGAGEGAPGGASDGAGRPGGVPGGAGRRGFLAKGARRGRGRAARKAGLLAIGVTASIIALGAGGYALLKPYLDPDDFEGLGSGTVTVHIPPGASAGDIGATLAGAGVVASARSFVNETQERAVAARLRPGHYRMRKGMAAGAALDLLLAPSSRVVRRVTVPEGMRASEALQRVAAQSGVPLKELRAADPALIGLPSYAPGLEGFLFPATYEVEPGDSAVDVLAAMVDRFGAAARKLRLAEGAARVGLTPLEAVTVASLVESEGGQESDYAKISRVIYNRLRSGTPLQLDATVTYAQNKRSLRVTEKDTKVPSPYNTYLHKGLPPGPIANPGEKALIAALRPAEGDWHWFVTTDPAHRITKFTNKESEFVRYREELNRNLGTK